MTKDAIEPVTNDLKQKKILIVDDDPHTTNVLSRFLLSRGHAHVESINDARHAAYAVGDYQPDMILLDVMMPHINGLEILRELEEAQIEHPAAVIMLTAMEDEKTKRMALILGADEFVQKPIGPQELSDRVCQVLQKHLQKQHTSECQ